MEPADPTPSTPPAESALGDGTFAFLGNFGMAGELLESGGPAIWAIAALSVATLAIILWKLWRFAWIGVWRHDRAQRAVALWRDYRGEEALDLARNGRGVRARVAAAALGCLCSSDWNEEDAREETVRVARIAMQDARTGLRALETIATIAPLLGLLGTVLGMIEAFQELQASGARADPSALAGGIWEALLTTAAGMAVAIPASIALSWFESITDSLRHDLEDLGAQLFARPEPAPLRHAAE